MKNHEIELEIAKEYYSGKGYLFWKSDYPRIHSLLTNLGWMKLAAQIPGRWTDYRSYSEQIKSHMEEHRKAMKNV